MRLGVRRRIRRRLSNQLARDRFVQEQLERLPAGARILDAGAGSQRYREFCAHLRYEASDFGQFTTEEAPSLATSRVKRSSAYPYGPLDYVGDIWDIPAPDGQFDAILCTEVLEHIPYPIATIREFSRLLRPGGLLILTAPSTCLRHYDPFFFSSGFSNHWYTRILPENGIEVVSVDPVGDYYSWISVELLRTARTHSLASKVALGSAFLYFLSRKPTQESISTLCMGYHVVGRKH